MKTVDFLEHLRSLDIRVNVNGEQLRINAPNGSLTPELQAELRARKAEILALLHQPNHKAYRFAMAYNPCITGGEYTAIFCAREIVVSRSVGTW